jgi:hypothetical protein
MQRRSDREMELPADAEPDQEGGSSRRQFIRRLAAISAGLTVAAPMARGVAVTEETHENCVSRLTTKKTTVLMSLLSTDCYRDGNSRGKLMENRGK